MKLSKRNIKNQKLKSEKLAGKKPIVSSYAAENRPEAKEKTDGNS
jgi:hypothetical protein